MLQPPTIYRHRRLVTFETTVTYRGEVLLNDCNDEQIADRIDDAITSIIEDDPLGFHKINHKILSVSNEDLTSNHHPQ